MTDPGPAGPGGRPRYSHLAGSNPWVLARQESAAAAEVTDTGEVAVVRPVREVADDGRLVRSSVVVGLGTLLSRLTGLGRVVALTFAVGSLAAADAYNLANTTPNIVYELLLGGVLSATLVPIFVDRFEHDDDEAVSAVLTVATVVLVVLTALAMLGAPLVFAIYGADDLAPAGVPLLRLLLPQMLFYGWTALGTAVLNARRRFAVPAFAPVLNNIVVSGALIAFGLRVSAPTIDSLRSDRLSLWLLGAGTTAGIVAMTIPLLPAIRRAGVVLRWRFAPRHPAVRTVIRRAGWTLGYVAANQIGLTIVLALAVDADTGLLSSYTYAFIFFQLPHGLVAVSIMTTYIPELSSAWGAGEVDRYRERFGSGLRLLWTGVVPAAAAYVVVAHPLIRLLLERGSFDAAAADSAGDVLATMTIGLPGFSAYLFALRGFYAQGDTRTPFVLNLVENGLQVGLTAALITTMANPAEGIGLAYAIAYTVAAVVALVTLHRRAGGVLVRRLAATVGRLVVAGGAMVGAMAIVRDVVLPASVPEVVGVVAEIAVGVAGFVVVARLMRLTEVRQLVGGITGRGAGR